MECSGRHYGQKGSIGRRRTASSPRTDARLCRGCLQNESFGQIHYLWNRQQARRKQSGQKRFHDECRDQLGYQSKLERWSILHSGSQKQPGEPIRLTFGKVQLLIRQITVTQGWNQQWFHPFSFLHPSPYSQPYWVRQTAWYPHQIKCTPPIDNLSPFFINIYRETSARRGYFPKCSKIVFPKK